MADNTERILLDVSINYAALAKQIDDAKSKIDKLTVQGLKLNEALKQAKLGGDKKAIDDANAALLENQAQLKASVKEQKELERQSVVLAQSQNATTGSLTQQRRELSLLTAQYVGMSREQRESAEGTALRDQIKSVSDGLKEQEKAIGDTRRNVGNYKADMISAAEQTGLFSGKVGDLKNTFNAVKSGAASAREGMIVVKNSFLDAGGAIKNFGGSISSAFSSLKDGKGLSGVKDAFSGIGAAGSAAFRAIGAAVAASGVGLIVIGVAALINYLRQVDPLVEKFEQGFAAVGAVIDVVGKGIFEFGRIVVSALKNPLEFIRNFSLDNLINGFKGVYKEAQAAGQAAANLKKQEQELEDLQIASIKTQGELRREAEKNRTIEQDRTRSAVERIKANELANAAEKKLLQEQLSLAEKEAETAKGKLKQDEDAKKFTDEIRRQSFEADERVADLRFQLTNQDNKNQQESARLILQLQKDVADGRLAILNEELRQIELYGGLTLDAKKKIAKQELDSALADSNASADAKKAAQLKYDNDIKEIEINHQKELKELRGKAMSDLLTDTSRQREKELELYKRYNDAQLSIETSDAAHNIDAQFQLRLEAINAAFANEIEVQKKAHEDELLANDQHTNNKLHQLESDTEFKKLSQEDQNKIISDIIQTGQEQENEILRVQTAEKLATVKKSAEDIAQATQEAADKKVQAIIEQQNLEAEAGGSPQARYEADIQILKAKEEAELQSYKDRLGAGEEFNKQSLLIEQKYNNLRQELKDRLDNGYLNATKSTLGTAKELFKKSSAEYKILAIAQTTIDTYQAAQAAFKSLVSIPVYGPVLGAAAAGVAIASGLANVAKIQGVQFAEGGVIKMGTTGKADDVPILASKGEAIINAQSTAEFTPLLSYINSYKGYGKAFATGGIAGVPTITSTAIAPFSALTNSTSSGDAELFKQMIASNQKLLESNERVNQSIQSIPRTAVVVPDINQVQQDMARAESRSIV